MAAATLLLLSCADALVPNGSVATAIFRFLPPSPFGLAALEEPSAPKRRRHHNRSLYDEILVETLHQPVPENHWTPLVIFLFLAAMLIGMILAFLCVLCCMRYFHSQVRYRAMKELNGDDVHDEGLREAAFRARMKPVETGTQTSSRNDSSFRKWSFVAKPDEAELQRAFQIKFQEQEMRRKREEEEEQRRLKLLQLEEEAKRAKEEAELRSEEYERKLRDVEVMSKELLDIRSGMKRKRGRGRRDTSLQKSSGGSEWQQSEQLKQQQQEEDIAQDEAHSSSSQMRLDLQFKQDSKGKSKCSVQAYVDPAVDGYVAVDTPYDSPPDNDMAPGANAFQLRHEDNFRKETYNVSEIRDQARRKNTDTRTSRSASSFVPQDVNEYERLAVPGFSRRQNNQAQQQRRLTSSNESYMASGHQSSNKGSQALPDDMERTKSRSEISLSRR
ncbi:uncharacterized protein LOC135386174 [Ornithodoros turicata]|uniref:uncharacterized protein LOC135386174 n=1 Tax=Ornithodoros turicata TaxID=34597 RepID=UPI003139492B